jgi:uncharacterized sulfatase
LIAHRHEAQWRQAYDWAFAKRPAEELYDLAKDRDQVRNVADDPAYGDKKAELSAKLMKVLTDAADPRVAGGEVVFERPPFTDPSEKFERTRGKGKKGKE